MLFSAGMGIGLVFWGVSEPLSHYATPPPFAPAADSATLGRTALRVSFFHWGLHAWGVYTVIGLALAYAKFRQNEPGLISSTFRPLIGNRVNGRMGNIIDVLATLATVFGVATSLGFGALQINGGLSDVFGGSVGEQTGLIIARRSLELPNVPPPGTPERFYSKL